MLGGCGALARLVALKDDGFVEDVTPQRDGEVRMWVVLVAEGFELREGVDGGEDFGGGEDVRWQLGGDDEAIVFR